MSFVQVIEFKTTRFDEVNALMDEWVEKTEGTRTALRAMTCSDRDNPDTYIEIVEFPSYEEAMKNSEMPETGEFAARLESLCDGPLSFRNLDLTREW